MLSKIFGNWDWRHWILSHIVWIVAVSAALFFGHIALQNHDATLAANATIKASQDTIAQLKQQIAQTDAAAASKVQTIVKVVHDAQTPAQVVQALPQIDPNIAAALNARVAPDMSNIVVAPQPLLQVVGDLEASKIQLGACQSDLTKEQGIEQAQTVEITALKKKPKFWNRVGSTLKVAGIGVGIGIIIGLHGI